VTAYGPFLGTLSDQLGNRIVHGVDGTRFIPADAPAPTPTPTPTPTPSSRRSGLAWNSGVFANDRTLPARFEALRGRRIDLADVHCEAKDVANPYWLRDYTPGTVGSLTLSCPLTAAQPPADFERAGALMAARGFKGPLARIRPGVELNLNNESTATDANVEAWISRFRTAANAFRKGAGPGSVVCLCVNEGEGSRRISRSKLEHLADVLLRDGSADELGVDFYDQWPPMPTIASFDDRTSPGRWGSIGWWADFASQRGRKVAIPEWGVARTDAGQWAGHAGGDNPTFVTSMIGWFRENAGRVGYEAYFAEPASYIQSDITTQMPKSRAAYVAALR
jgi:hypothetical protein